MYFYFKRFSKAGVSLKNYGVFQPFQPNIACSRQMGFSRLGNLSYFGLIPLNQLVLVPPICG